MALFYNRIAKLIS